MKNLKDVLEKLKVDDIVIDAEFPIDGTIDDIVEFLKSQGFKEISDFKYFNERIKSKCFLPNDETIYFTDISKEKISKKNPLFYIEESSIGNFIYDVYGKENDMYVDIVNNSKKAFLKELNKRFGW